MEDHSTFIGNTQLATSQHD